MSTAQKMGFLSLLLGTAIMSGCISISPTPSFARSGDVVNINLGGIKRNAAVQNFKANDFVVTITDCLPFTHTAKVNGVFRAYPDHTSVYSVGAQDRTDTLQYGRMYPHDGALWIAVQLTGADNNPLPLCVGPASIAVTTSPSKPLLQTTYSRDGRYDDFPIEIVAGVNPGWTEADNQDQAYTPSPYITVKPSGPLPGTVGGMQLELEIAQSLTAGHPFDLRLVPLSHDPNMSLVQGLAPKLGEETTTEVLTAFVTNTNGFIPDANVSSWMQGQSIHSDLIFAITSWFGIVGLSVTDATLSTYFTVTANSFYVDLNGDVIPGVTPMLIDEEG